MVKVVVSPVKKPSPSSPSRSTGGYIPITKKETQKDIVSQSTHSVTTVFADYPPLPGETQTQYDKRVFGESISPARPSPGVVVDDDMTTRVTLGRDEGGRFHWEKGETIETPTEITTLYTLKGTITPARKTEGITPLKDVTPSTYDVLKTTVGIASRTDFKKAKETGKSISQTTADLFGVSGQQSQELFAPVDVYGDPGYREKLLQAGIAEQGPSAKDIGTFLVQTPGYVGMGAGLSGIGGALKGAAMAKGASGAAVAGHGLFTYGLITSGAAMGTVTAADIFTTESKSMKEWKLFSTAAALGLMGYGAKPHGSVGRALTRMETHQYQAMASELNMRLGGPAEYGMYRVGRPGIQIGSSYQLKVEPIINKYGFKIGEQYTRGAETVFKPGDTTLIFEKPGASPFGKHFQMTNVGYSEAMNIVTPGVEKPIATGLFTKWRFRTGETKGLITSGDMLKYTKLEPTFTPYKDVGKPWGFEGTPLRFEKTPMTISKFTPSTVKTSGPVTGASARGLLTEFVEPLTQTQKRILFSDIMETPAFNVYPPGHQAPGFSAIVRPVDITKVKIDTVAQGVGARETQDLFKTETSIFKTSDLLDFKPDTIQDAWTKPKQAYTPKTKDITIPDVKVTPEVRQDQDKIFDITFDQPYPYDFPFEEPGYRPRPDETTTGKRIIFPGVPPMNLGDTGEKGIEDWIFRIRRERKHRIGDPFKALKEFKL